MCLWAENNGHKAGQGPHFFRHRPPRQVNSCVFLMDSAALVSPKEDILVMVKVHACISAKLTRKRLGRKMDVPALLQPLPESADMPLNGTWGQLQCCSCTGAALGLGLQLCSHCCSFSTSPPGSSPMAPSHGRSCQRQNEIHQFDISVPNEGRVVSYLALHQLLFLHSHLRIQQRGKNTLIMN